MEVDKGGDGVTGATLEPWQRVSWRSQLSGCLVG